MLQAFDRIWSAKVQRYGLAFGVVPIVASFLAMFVFQGEREDGMFETVEEFLVRRHAEDPPPPEMLSLGPAFDDCIRVETRLPVPEADPLPGVFCDPQDKVAFGSHIAAHGGFVAVGAHSDNSQGLDRGAVYIYRRTVDDGDSYRDGNAGWVLKTRILADAEMKPAALAAISRNTKFGRNVALANGVLAVMQGADYVGGPAGDDPEAVYVFGSDDGWTTWRQEARLANPQAGSGHGLATAFLDSGTLLVAAPMAVPVHEGAPRGAVYVYQRTPMIDGRRDWHLQGELRPPSESREDLTFGFSLAADENLVAVGMIGGGGPPRDGSVPWTVPLFRRKDVGAAPADWECLGGVKAPAVGANRTFGATIALKGGVLAIAQRNVADWDPEVGKRPMVWVYRNESGGPTADDWKLSGWLDMPVSWHHGDFGISVAIGRDAIATGSRSAGAGGQFLGCVFLYDISGISGQTFGRTLVADPAYPEVGFGQAVAMFGDSLFIAAESDPHPFPSHGSVFVWEP